MNEEKRRSPRINVLLDLRYRDGAVFRKGYITDIGKDGAFIDTDHPLLDNEVTYIIFTLPGSSAPIKVNAKVVWRNIVDKGKILPQGMGIEFKQLGKEETAQIEDFIKKSLTG